jgi:hypothetical protein
MPSLLGGSRLKSNRFRFFSRFFRRCFTRHVTKRSEKSKKPEKAGPEGKTTAWAGTTPVLARLSRPNLRKLGPLACWVVPAHA